MKWETKKIGDILTLEYGKPLVKENRNESGQFKVYASGGHIGNHDSFLVDYPTLIVGRKGSIGSIMYSDAPCWVIDTAYFIKLKKEINLKFLFYALGQFNFSSMNKAAAVPGLNRNDVYELKIPLPPLPIQQQIADTLDKADALRRKDQELLDKYDELAQAVFYEMFGDIKNRSKNWDWTSLESVLEDIVAGSSVGGEDKVLQNGELGVLKISAVTSGKFLKDEYKVPDQRLLPKNLIHPQKGDLLFSRANTRELVGATAIVESDCSNIFLPDKLWKLKPKPSVNSVYLKFILSEPSIKYELTKTATGTSGSMLNISMAKLRSLNIPLPYIDIQDSFAARIKMLNQVITNVHSTKKFSDGLFESLLTRIH